jgi:ribose-phosphate pyrophosphokinase
MQIIGDVKDKNVILVDDIVDTAGTISKAADLMMDNGAKSVRAIASHCIMSGSAPERVTNSKMTEIVFTNSIPFTEDCPKVKQLSVAGGFAEAIKCVLHNQSISSHYIC